MSHNLEADFAEMERKLKCYVDKGRVAGGAEVREEPLISVKPDPSLIKPLRTLDDFSGSFITVDCSTRTLKRANNCGVYLMRPAYAIVKKRVVNWDFKERICTVVGDARTRSNFLTDIRIELESQMALNLLNKKMNSYTTSIQILVVTTCCLIVADILAAKGNFASPYMNNVKKTD
jgi:hypothetical protein